MVNVFPVAAATIGSQGEKLTDFRALQRAGAIAISDDGRPILDDAIFRRAKESDHVLLDEEILEVVHRFAPATAGY